MKGSHLYRTRITHLRRAPVHHYFEHQGYSWYVDIDDLPEVPLWLRPFAQFNPSDHFDGTPDQTLRQRIDAFLKSRGVDLNGGRITALLQARVFGYVFNPVSLFWGHDADGLLRHVVMEMHNTRGNRHAYLLPPGPDHVSMTQKKLRVSPFNGVEGYYLVRAPYPDENLDVTVSLHRDNEPAFIATLRGTRRPAGVGEVLRLQAVAPVAPLMTALEFRVQNLTLWLRRVPVARRSERELETCSPADALVGQSSESR